MNIRHALTDIILRAPVVFNNLVCTVGFILCQSGSESRSIPSDAFRMSQNALITQAVLPIAGLGTRFLPWTKSVPKEMLPLGTRPFIALLVDECLSAGINDICFVISEGKESIPRYFEHDARLEKELAEKGKSHLMDDLLRYDSVHFHVVYQREPLGDGHAILQAADWVKSDEIAVLFGDDYFLGKGTALEQLLKAYALTAAAGERAVLAVENIPREKTKKYGIIDIGEQRATDPRLKAVKGLVEKPEPAKAPSTLGIVGRYLIPASTLRVLPSVHSHTKDGEIRLIDALIAQLSAMNIFAYECEGKRLDTGTPEGYRQAVIDYPLSA